MDRELAEAIDDLHAGFDEMVAANGVDQRYRRSLKSVLDDVYRIHERRGQDEGQDNFRQRAEQSVTGRMSLGEGAAVTG